jgi:putative copper export protein
LSLAISLFLGILGAVVWAASHHIAPKLTSVYRHFAPPIAIVVGLVVLIVSTVIEIRQYRQAKALAAIERLSFR